jgi:predicted PurR-regulated permease PerM
VQSTLSSPLARKRAWRWLVIVAVAAVSLWFASRIPRTLTVFTFAAFVAFGVYPIVVWLERRMPRAFAIAIVYVGLLASVVVLAFLVVPATFAQVQTLGANAPAYIATMQGWLDLAQHSLRARLGNAYLPPGYSDLQTLLASKVTAVFTGSLNSLTNVLVNAFTAVFITFSALVLSAFFLVQGEQVAESFYDLLPAHRRAQARALGAETAEVFGSYVSGQAALCTLTGALIVAMTAATGFKFALLLGILGGIAYAVPFVGQVVAHVVALVLAAPQGPQTTIWVQVAVFVAYRVADMLLTPKIMSERVGVSPIVVMFSVFAGGELFGLPGLLFGIPAAALAKIAWRFFRTETADPTAEIIAPGGIAVIEAAPVEIVPVEVVKPI